MGIRKFCLAMVVALGACLAVLAPRPAAAATVGSDLVSFISVATIDATTPEVEGAGTLDDPYTGTITAPVGSEELAYLSVMFTDANAKGTASYLLQDEASTPASEAAIDLPTTNNGEGRCNSDEPLEVEPGRSYTLWVVAKASADAATSEIYELQVSVIGKTAQPILETYTVYADEGNTELSIPVVNTDDYPEPVTVTVTNDGGGTLSGVSATYEDGTITVIFDEPVAGQMKIRFKFQAEGEGASDLTAVIDVYPHGTSAPATPQFESPVMAEAGNLTTTVKLTGPAYAGYVEVDLYGEDGFIAGGVAPAYDAETNSVTLTFDEPITKVMNYDMSIKVNELESGKTELQVLPNPNDGGDPAVVTVYRFYNPYLEGAHLFSADPTEILTVTKAGWIPEGGRFTEYADAGVGRKPVYRLYNPNNGDHFFTTSTDEVAALTKIGWQDEGAKWYGTGNDGVAVYRLYNPYQTYDAGLGNHLWTSLPEENEYLTNIGWEGEGIGWYAIARVV